MKPEEVTAALREMQKAYRQTHKEKIAENQRRYQRKHRAQLNAYAKAYRKAHPEKVKQWRENAARRWMEKKAQEAPQE